MSTMSAGIFWWNWLVFENINEIKTKLIGLQKHVNKSKLHKENLDKLKHPEPDEEDEDDTEAYK